ncbi:MAG: nucleotidyl transferase AbiEii/AbiGii toxin family protein [Chloroflexi bacterium]|nr:nucleotidyl transferase AbiEii/AbiGii toxin family protein [Chloroflexota bacterium]
MTRNSLLSGKGLLTPLQRSFLSLFSQLADKDQFYLTGGTALAEYYLGHRLSFDLDLFTGIDGLVLPVSYQVEVAGKAGDLKISVVRRFATYVEFLVTDHQARLKVDLALDPHSGLKPRQPPQMASWSMITRICGLINCWHFMAAPNRALRLTCIASSKKNPWNIYCSKPPKKIRALIYTGWRWR